MKRIVLLITAILLTAGVSAQSGKGIYNKYSDAKDVSAVYISPAMLRLVGKLPDMEIGDGEVNLTPIIKAMSGFYLISSENKSVSSAIRDDVRKLVKSGDYEMMMEVKEDGQTVHIYTLSKDDTITNLVFLAYEPEECTFICIEGNMSKSELEKAIASAISEYDR
ncbi:MAG: DUF4252 domain-containing protein [Bacteroidaceae bacterium]|nr:DUF4252 domain-containing protein [Bacteroidaceae bacterium]